MVYEEINSNKEKIAKVIQEYYQSKIQPLLAASPAYNCAVVDFALLRDGDDYVPKVIELNPFNNYEGAGTGGSLFHWTGDRDILEGKEPFEFRTLYDSPDLTGRVFPDWLDIIEAGERLILEAQSPKPQLPSSSSDQKSPSSCIVS